MNSVPYRRILGMRVDATSYSEAVQRVCRRAAEQRPGYVCVANVHMVMEAHDDPNYRAIVSAADLVTADGVPLVWALRWLGLPGATRVYGPDLTLRLCAAAAATGLPVGFYGGTPEVLKAMEARLRERWPELMVAYRYSPPFRPLAPAEDAVVVAEIEHSGARLLFVGLGCPKQERWMAEHLERVPAVMLGVGAAFDFIAGVKPQAPAWMQGAGLEWLFRLATEPRRLWRRYLYHNPRFLCLFAMQLSGLRQFGEVRP